jgi:hypothetical protein
LSAVPLDIGIFQQSSFTNLSRHCGAAGTRRRNLLNLDTSGLLSRAELTFKLQHESESESERAKLADFRSSFSHARKLASRSPALQLAMRLSAFCRRDKGTIKFTAEKRSGSARGACQNDSPTISSLLRQSASAAAASSA